MDLRRLLAIAIVALLPTAVFAQTGPNNPVTPQHVICDSGCGSGGVGASVDISSVAGNIIVGANVPTTVASGSITFTNTSLAVTNAGTFAVQATLAAETTKVIGTVNQGTNPWTVNLITGFALETGGNLASVKTNTDKIPALGQALAAGSVPIVLTAIQQAALTPPAAITGFALAATQTDKTQFTKLTDGTRDGTVKAASTLPALTDTALVTTQRDPLPAGTNVIGQVNQGTSPWVENVSQINGTAPSMGSGVNGTGVLRVSPATDSAITSASGALGALNAELKVTIGTGNAGCGFNIQAGTLAGTITFQHSPDDATYSTLTTVAHNTLTQAGTAVFTNPNGNTYFTPLLSDGDRYFKVLVSAYTSGTANGLITCTPVVSSFAVGALSMGLPGQVHPLIVNNIGGTDGTNVQRVNILNTRPSSSQYAVITRPLMPSNGTQDMPTMDAVGRAGFQEITDGTDVALVTTDGSLQAEPPRTNYVAFSGQESVAAGVADTWYIRRQWALPASAHFIPSAAWATITTALTKTLVGVANSLGTLNVGTNAFAATNSVASPFFYGRLFGCVTTVLSATLDTVTPTYTDELGNSQAATGVAFAASLPVGNCMEFPLNAATPASTLDTGVRAVTAAVDTAATTGVITFYGVNALADFAGTSANQTEWQALPQIPELNSNEQIVILMRQAAVTAQLKTFGLGGSLR